MIRLRLRLRRSNCRPGGHHRHGWRAADGNAALELVILVTILLGLLGLVVAAGRTSLAQGSVDAAARDAARQASIAFTPTAAVSAGSASATAALRQDGLACAAVVSIDTSGFLAPPGQPAMVWATVTCTVALAGLALPGLPGHLTMRARFGSPLDTYRSRALTRRLGRRGERREDALDRAPDSRPAHMNVSTGRRRGRADAERGALSLMIVVLFVAFVALAGIVVDGGAKLNADENAAAAAQEAARAGATTVDVSGAYATGSFVVDQQRAIAAARAYLAGSGYDHYSVTTAGSRAIRVSVTITEPTRFLSMIGVRSFTCTGTATAVLVIGVTGGQ